MRSLARGPTELAIVGRRDSIGRSGGDRHTPAVRREASRMTEDKGALVKRDSSGKLQVNCDDLWPMFGC